MWTAPTRTTGSFPTATCGPSGRPGTPATGSCSAQAGRSRCFPAASSRQASMASLPAQAPTWRWAGRCSWTVDSLTDLAARTVRGARRARRRLCAGGGRTHSTLHRRRWSGCVPSLTRISERLRTARWGLPSFSARCSPPPDRAAARFAKVSVFESPVAMELWSREIGEGIAVVANSVADEGRHAGELYQRGISKADGVVAVIHLGIPREDTIAIGDGANDLEMIAYAGVGDRRVLPPRSWRSRAAPPPVPCRRVCAAFAELGRISTGPPAPAGISGCP